MVFSANLMAFRSRTSSSSSLGFSVRCFFMPSLRSMRFSRRAATELSAASASAVISPILALACCASFMSSCASAAAASTSPGSTTSPPWWFSPLCRRCISWSMASLALRCAVSFVRICAALSSAALTISCTSFSTSWMCESTPLARKDFTVACAMRRPVGGQKADSVVSSMSSPCITRLLSFFSSASAFSASCSHSLCTSSTIPLPSASKISRYSLSTSISVASRRVTSGMDTFSLTIFL
mmetsp:Transcript_13755/g.30335  ORF Transcript_13755/g.30335 Transcript_13755/m.30335 type:complete len:240 (+) Transcript_13755:2923-3642(+)